MGHSPAGAVPATAMDVLPPPRSLRGRVGEGGAPLPARSILPRTKFSPSCPRSGGGGRGPPAAGAIPATLTDDGAHRARSTSIHLTPALGASDPMPYLRDVLSDFGDGAMDLVFAPVCV